MPTLNLRRPVPAIAHADTAHAEEHSMSTARRIAALEGNLNQTLDWVSRFDNKSSIVLGASTGMLGLLSTLAPPIGSWTPFVIVTTVLSVGLLATSLLLVYVGTSPQIRGVSRSILYFGSIGRRNFDEYRREFLEQTPEAYQDELLGQCHRNSQVLCHKLRFLRLAYASLFLAVLPWTVSVFLFRSI